MIIGSGVTVVVRSEVEPQFGGEAEGVRRGLRAGPAPEPAVGIVPVGGCHVAVSVNHNHHIAHAVAMVVAVGAPGAGGALPVLF